jgi:hypothetical protein
MHTFPADDLIALLISRCPTPSNFFLSFQTTPGTYDAQALWTHFFVLVCFMAPPLKGHNKHSKPRVNACRSSREVILCPVAERGAIAPVATTTFASPGGRLRWLLNTSHGLQNQLASFAGTWSSP